LQSVSFKSPDKIFEQCTPLKSREVPGAVCGSLASPLALVFQEPAERCASTFSATPDTKVLSALGVTRSCQIGAFELHR
jgi:hypothetical protein